MFNVIFITLLLTGIYAWTKFPSNEMRLHTSNFDKYIKPPESKIAHFTIMTVLVCVQCVKRLCDDATQCYRQ